MDTGRRSLCYGDLARCDEEASLQERTKKEIMFRVDVDRQFSAG